MNHVHVFVAQGSVRVRSWLRLGLVLHEGPKRWPLAWFSRWWCFFSGSAVLARGLVVLDFWVGLCMGLERWLGMLLAVRKLGEMVEKMNE